MFPRFLAIAGMAFALSGCADAISDLDFDFRGNGVSGGNVATAPRPEPDANGLITYPTYQVVVARPGDTVASVATRVGIPAAELAEFNGRTGADQLRPGEILAMPRIVAPGPGGGAATDITAIASAAIDAAGDQAGTEVAGVRIQPGTEPVRHRVARGETAYSIARLYDIPVRSLAEWNGLGPDLAVREGQYLVIPLAVAGTTAAADAGRPGSSTPPPPPSAAEPLPGGIQTAPLPSAPDLSDNSEPAPEPEPEPEPEPVAETQLQRPVDGQILRGFSGSNEGVDIAAATGSPVRAAEDGEVAAITQDTDQIPILVIRHSGNLLTVYANIQDIRVSRGDRVSRGEVVAGVGPGDPPFLHFEVRQGFEAVDPLPFIE